MSIYYSQSITLDTSLNKGTVKDIINQGALLGFAYRNWEGEILDNNKAIECILFSNEHRYSRLFVAYQDNDFLLCFTGSESSGIYVSLNPPNSTWTLEEYGINWIDNARYSRLLLYLCKDLPIVGFTINREDFTLPEPSESNTIHISGGFGPREESKANAKILVNNIFYYGFKPTDKISPSNLEALIDYALETDELLTFALEINTYVIKVSISDLISVTAVEPYAIKIINNKKYIDVAFYVEVGFKITDTFLISTISSNFEAPRNI